MTDPPRYPDSSDDTRVGPDRESTTGTPRWVKIFGIIALAVVVLFVVLMFTRGPGDHGPGRHTLEENQEQEIDNDDEDGHHPSKSDH